MRFGLSAALLARGSFALAFACMGSLACSADDDKSRQETVDERGAEVMPFDLDKTLHHFDKTQEGGLETVVVKDLLDEENTRLIREHLQEEAAKFARGDFSDPAHIHGSDMPGLATLASAGDALHIAYSEVRGGAQLEYTSTDAEIIAAIHDWFDAQTMDHGSHGPYE